MNNDLEKILFTQEQIDKRIGELGAQITKDYAGKKLLLIGVLKGCYVFLADLARKIDLDVEIQFLTASSYGFSSVSSGMVSVDKAIDFITKGRDVIVIEDILDTGVTLTALHAMIIKQKPASLKICTLLDKPERREMPIKADYTGFTCPNEFVVGYGLDYAEKYRTLPFVAVLKKEIYE